jgi:hypothetical protein
MTAIVILSNMGFVAVGAFLLRSRRCLWIGFIAVVVCAAWPQPRIYVEYNSVEGMVYASLTDSYWHQLSCGFWGAIIGIFATFAYEDVWPYVWMKISPALRRYYFPDHCD